MVNACNECINKTCLKSKKPCKEIEKQLRQEGIYDANFIRPKVSYKKSKKDGFIKWREIPFDINSLEKIANDRAEKLQYGQSFYKSKQQYRNTLD